MCLWIFGVFQGEAKHSPHESSNLARDGGAQMLPELQPSVQLKGPQLDVCATDNCTTLHKLALTRMDAMVAFIRSYTSGALLGTYLARSQTKGLLSP